MSDGLGTRGPVAAGSVGALIDCGVAGSAVAAEGHGVAEQRAALAGAAGQDGRAVLHLVVGAASLEQKAQAHQVSDVAVLFG